MTKAISLDNLAQFKAKCDETYAKVGEGGITLSQVIAREETLPAATADSPDFVQTPDGTLYRKKAVEGGANQLSGTWVWNDKPAPKNPAITQNINFTSNGQSFTSIKATFYDSIIGDVPEIYYNSTIVCNGDSGYWVFNNVNYKTIDFGTQPQTVAEDFYTYFTANATKQGGGASVSYEYVAQQDAGASGGESTVTGYSVTVNSTFDMFLRDNKGILKKHVGNSGQTTYQNITEIYYSYSPGTDAFNISNPTYVATVFKAKVNTTNYYHDFLQGDISITISAGGGASPVG